MIINFQKLKFHLFLGWISFDNRSVINEEALVLWTDKEGKR